MPSCTGAAAWRGLAEGTGGAAAAVIIVNLNASGLAANWLLPLVPAAVGALAHQAGMMYERLGVARSTAGPANAKPAGTVVTGTAVAPTSPAPAVPAAHTHAAPMSVPEAMLRPVKSVRPPMPASLALLELAEAQKAESMQARRDSARATAPVPQVLVGDPTPVSPAVPATSGRGPGRHRERRHPVGEPAPRAPHGERAAGRLMVYS